MLQYFLFGGICVIDIILDTLIDGIKLLPFLFLAFLFIELLEHKFSNKTKKVIEKSGNLGPLLGGLLGIFPQCGFSVMATNLYVTRIISVGTLISIYLSTSDEMLPILLSRGASFEIIFKILLIKVIIGIICGFIIDLIFGTNFSNKKHYDICEEEHCHCEDGLIKSSIKHTLNILVFILGVSFILNIIMEYVGEDILSSIFNSNNLLSPVVASLIGFIPNCGSSVIITGLYLNNVISLSATIAGLLTGSGVAWIVLFRSNRDIKDNVKILFIVYIIGVISGLLIELLEFIF